MTSRTAEGKHTTRFIILKKSSNNGDTKFGAFHQRWPRLGISLREKQRNPAILERGVTSLKELWSTEFARSKATSYERTKFPAPTLDRDSIIPAGPP